ncbi:hypothetical protein J1779_17610 [Rahnella sp. FC061912-K]|uniref:T6SS immunity protein Tli3 family protein n=1 Tax=Rahnella rivi TaxID=2816249 RepID=UPI001C280240|nr:hypothetical protein [Rahnella rivi]MBU9831758.1 hypothetical protein [Rahnella rivi]
MKPIKIIAIIVLANFVHACNAAPQSPPTQVVYRFDNHRYLELVGYNCEGALWFTDTKLGIHSQVEEQFYKIFTKRYIHPSERYVAITEFEGSGFYISKDFGRTWDMASYAPGGGAVRYADDKPQREDIESFTVVNDQGFMLTKAGDIYMSSKPFDDPRLSPGGSGIAYTFLDHRGNLKQDRLMPGNSGLDWGREYLSWNSVNSPKPWVIDAFKPNWQNIPNKVPEVKNYTGWDHMRCDPNLGLASK